MEKILLITLLIHSANCSISIIFDAVYSPPNKLPENKYQVYNVALNQKATKPIYAYLVKNGIKLTIGVDASSKVRNFDCLLFIFLNYN